MYVYCFIYFSSMSGQVTDIYEYLYLQGIAMHTYFETDREFFCAYIYFGKKTNKQTYMGMILNT